MKVYLNGKIIDEKDAKISIHDHGFLYGDSVFETLKYKSGEVLNFEKHLKRLKNSAKIIELKIPNVDIKQVIYSLIKENNLIQARIRVTLTRGENKYDFNTCVKPTLLITAVSFEDKVEWKIKGTKTCTLEIERPIPNMKTVQLLSNTLARQKMKKLECDECFLINRHGEITEGSVSNFFVVKNGIIYTPPLKDCLEGTVRENIFELCKSNNIKIEEKKIKYEELGKYDEAFWTNSPNQIVPIKTINDLEFECVGIITQKLIKLLYEI